MERSGNKKGLEKAALRLKDSRKNRKFYKFHKRIWGKLMMR